MENKQYSHLFGPVPSRRFGRSLGIDLIPFKTCNFDCVFCQLGRTTTKTMERKEYVPVDEIIAQLGDWLGAGGEADYITLAGSGEPTLHSAFGQIIEFAHSATRIPVALLTNGALLSDPAVRAAAAQADVVKVSLSAWDQLSLGYVNRPACGILFEELIEGQRLFREQFKGMLWLEVFLAWGMNSTSSEVATIAKLVQTIGPDKIQLNTAVRPPCEEYATAVPQNRLLALAQLFDPPAEVIAEYSSSTSANVQANEANIQDMLERRPCTLEQICEVFGLHRNEAAKYLGKLTRAGLVVQHRQSGESYYAGAHVGKVSHADG